MKVTKKMWK